MKRWEEKYLEANLKQAHRRAGDTGIDLPGWRGRWGRTSPGTKQELWQLPRAPGVRAAERAHATEAPCAPPAAPVGGSSPEGHKEVCHLWQHISAALGEDEPLLSLFPLRLIQRVSKRSGDSCRNREKENRNYSRY